MDDQKLNEVTAAIREKYDGPMSLLSVEDIDIIVRPADKARFDRFRDSLLDDKKRGAAFEVLLKSCLLYPSAKDFDAILAEKNKPGLMITFAEKISKNAGTDADVEEKKL